MQLLPQRKVLLMGPRERQLRTLYVPDDDVARMAKVRHLLLQARLTTVMLQAMDPPPRR